MLTYLALTGKWPLNIQILNYNTFCFDQIQKKKARKSIFTMLASEVRKELNLSKLPLSFFSGNGNRIFDFNQIFKDGKEKK